MRTLVLDLVPHEPAVFSRSAATKGGHATHIAPTGAALQGWAAGKLWGQFGDARAADIFLSGKVRFSDAVHMADGAALFPQPAILLAPKHGGGPPCLGRAAFEATHNPNPNDPKIQADRPSLGLFTLDGRYARRPDLSQRLRTATEDGRAKRGSLFGYQAVKPSGASLRATVEADDDVSDKEWEELCNAFAGRLFLGRGSANGYGGAYDCTSVEGSPWPAGFEGEAEWLRIWFLTDAVLCNNLSDMELCKEWENPHVRPGPADFGLDKSWSVEGPETAVTTRRVWPWNRVLGCRELEVGVIEAGSVVTLKRKEGPAAVRIGPVVGLHRERGWGRIAVIPATFAIRPLAVADLTRGPASTGEDSALVAWAKGRAAVAAREAQSDAAAETLVKVVIGLVKQLGEKGPSPSQWKLVEGAARKPTNTQQALRQTEWGETVGMEAGGFKPLREWVEHDLLGADMQLSAKLRVIQAAQNAAQQVRQ